jgi:hypothetical protein
MFLQQEGRQLGDLLIVSLSSDTFWNRGEGIFSFSLMCNSTDMSYRSFYKYPTRSAT